MSAEAVAVRIANTDRIVPCLHALLIGKYQLDMAYRSYADRLPGMHRDAFVEHWQEHAEEERKAAYDVSMRLFGMGVDPAVAAVRIPECSPDVAGIVSSLASLEVASISNARTLADVAGQDAALRAFAEDLALLDTQHMDDLKRMSGISL